MKWLSPGVAVLLTLGLAASCGSESRPFERSNGSAGLEQGADGGTGPSDEPSAGGEGNPALPLGGASPGGDSSAGGMGIQSQAGDANGSNCDGITCESPPANRCDSPTTFRAFDTAGSCDAGVCSYVSHVIDCDCRNDACESDPCKNITCNSPPAASCPTARTKRAYASSGTCASGSCSYAQTDENCPDNQACLGGACAVCKSDDGCGPTCAPCTAGNPRCLAQGGKSTCVECLGDGDCTLGAKCNLGTHVCYVPSCVNLAKTCGLNSNEDCCTTLAVPGGTFSRSNDSQAVASVSSFHLDKFEVTVGRFRKYVNQYSASAMAKDTGKNPNNPESMGWHKEWDALLAKDTDALTTQLFCTDGTWTGLIGANENKPISCVGWYDAFAFCVWDGGRLPTEAEWNYAAAGGNQQRVYPWSQPPADTTADPAYAVYSPAVGPLNVGSKGIHSARWGHVDLAGNMGEWVKDFDGPYPVPCSDCEIIGPTLTGPHIYRGGSWQHPAGSITTSYRTFTSPNAVTGIRCARDP